MCIDMEVAVAGARVRVRSAVRHCDCTLCRVDDRTGCDAKARTSSDGKASATECLVNRSLFIQVTAVQFRAPSSRLLSEFMAVLTTAHFLVVFSFTSVIGFVLSPAVF